MPNSTLPSRPSLEYLRKLAKDRLPDLRRSNPRAQLADALFAVAQDHGFSSWRALKAEVDRRHGDLTSRWFEAVTRGDIDTVRAVLREDPSLLQSRQSRHDQTALHIAASAGNVDMARLLLDAGADPNDARDDAGIGVLGWATFVGPQREIPMDVVSLLLERGGRHSIFSAIATGDPDVVRALAEQHPTALDAQLPPRYHGQTPLHFAIARNCVDVLDQLIELGADVDAADGNGQTALEFAMLRRDGAAADRLRAAGAREPTAQSSEAGLPTAAGLASSVQSATLVVGSRDVAATLAWYTSIGFTETARYPTDGSAVFWGMVTLGAAELTFDVRVGSEARGAALLLETDRVQELYDLLGRRQLETADVEFVRTLHEPEHGGLEFSIRDPNGFVLRFHQQSL
jgi:ankyrin repeat protein